MSAYALVIHGGAGNIQGTPEEIKAYKDSLRRIALAGQAILESGGSSLATVTHCVNLLEDDPLYNAGKGAVFNTEGKVECDASVMDGSNLEAGACAGLTTVKNPIKLASAILKKSEHVMLIGDGAEKFADQFSEIERVTNDYFYTEKRLNQLKEAKKQDKAVLDHSDLDAENEKKYGTVGAVAFDQNGNLAAATSTGGITNKKWGRVGDSPIIGAGTYADNQTCGVSCTGYGEQFIRTGLAKTISDLVVFKNLDAFQASSEAMNYLTEKVNGLGGAIVIDSQGNIGTNFTTPGILQAAVNSQTKEPQIDFDKPINLTLHS